MGRMVVTGKVDFKSKVVSAMRSLQKNPRKICAFFQKSVLAICRLNMNMNLLMD